MFNNTHCFGPIWSRIYDGTELESATESTGSRLCYGSKVSAPRQSVFGDWNPCTGLLPTLRLGLLESSSCLNFYIRHRILLTAVSVRKNLREGKYVSEFISVLVGYPRSHDGSTARGMRKMCRKESSNGSTAFVQQTDSAKRHRGSGIVNITRIHICREQ